MQRFFLNTLTYSYIRIYLTKLTHHKSDLAASEVDVLQLTDSAVLGCGCYALNLTVHVVLSFNQLSSVHLVIVCV